MKRPGLDRECGTRSLYRIAVLLSARRSCSSSVPAPRSPRRRASRAPRPLARGRCPPPPAPTVGATGRALAAHSFIAAPNALGGGGDIGMPQRRGGTQPDVAADGRRRPQLNSIVGCAGGGESCVGVIGDRGAREASSMSSAAARPTSAVRACKACHQPLAHRASGLGRGDAGRFLDPTRAAPLRAPSCPWRAQRPNSSTKPPEHRDRR